MTPKMDVLQSYSMADSSSNLKESSIFLVSIEGSNLKVFENVILKRVPETGTSKATRQR